MFSQKQTNKQNFFGVKTYITIGFVFNQAELVNIIMNITIIVNRITKNSFGQCI